MAVVKIERWLISYCEIPEELIENHWISEYRNGCMVDYTVSKKDDENIDELNLWIIKQYPFLEGEEILIEMDY